MSEKGAGQTVLEPRVVRVSLLIPTHALSPLSYRVPPRLRAGTQPGTAVVAPLAGHPRLGLVVQPEDVEDGRLEDIRRLVPDLSLPAGLVDLCSRVSEDAAVPLPAVLRAALPPGLKADRYRVDEPAPDWPWKKGAFIGRTTLRRALGGEGLEFAEAEGRISFAPGLEGPESVEWAVLADGVRPDLRRAPRQEQLFELLERLPSGCRTTVLISRTGARRETLLRLVRRGAVRLERRPARTAGFLTRGRGAVEDLAPFAPGAERVVGGGAWIWRTPTREQPEVAAAVARAAAQKRKQALILAPEIKAVERLVRDLRHLLPAGLSVAPYHSELGRGRISVYEAARDGSLDILVGTRATALVPLPRLGAICVTDEPNGAYRAQPGFEGIPVHVREVTLMRGDSSEAGAGVVFTSSVPSLALYAPEARIQELPARRPWRWPAASIVDMRGSGAALGSALLEACGQRTDAGERVGVVANRLGYATALSCNRCGAVRSCPECGLPLALHDGTNLLVCSHCGRKEPANGDLLRCKACGSGRLSPTGLAVERVREEISDSLGEPVGLLTAERQEETSARVVVGTARYILADEWDLVAVPDADSLLSGGGVTAAERAFRMLYGAAEAARRRLLIQTRNPEHYVLRTALRGDFGAFLAAELPRRRSLSYPPYSHLAEIILAGPEEVVRGAVESRLRSALEPGVEMLEPIPRPGTPAGWRVLLRSGDRRTLARAATFAAWLAARNKLKARINMDPEEV